MCLKICMSKLNLIAIVSIVAAFAVSVVVADSGFAQNNSTNSTTSATAVGNASSASAAAGGNTTSMNIPSTSPGSTSGY
jgi:hypothetical protein